MSRWSAHGPGAVARSGAVSIPRPALWGFVWRCLLYAAPFAVLGYGVFRAEGAARRAASHEMALVAVGLCVLVFAASYALLARPLVRRISYDRGARTVTVRGEHASFDDVADVGFIEYRRRRGVRPDPRSRPPAEGLPSVDTMIYVTLRSGTQAARPFRMRMVARTMPEPDARLLHELATAVRAPSLAQLTAAFARQYGWGPHTGAPGSAAPGYR
ncbi:hypothetical protein [Georgenia sp. Z1491]|uniref:hypothetical protein n=1 Tax=Georgenia sp. Z1491 TaxID=3416707 RepID=UPI003CEBEF9B